MSEESDARPEDTEDGASDDRMELGIEPRRLDYVLIRHMGRSPRTRTMRAARAGHRRQGVLLDDGTRIRKKGRQRLTEVSLDRFVQNHTRLLEYVRIGAIEVLEPLRLTAISYEELKRNLEGMAGERFDESSQVPQDVVPGSEHSMNTAPTKPTKGAGSEVLTLKEVMNSGYSKEEAERIVADEQRMKEEEELRAEAEEAKKKAEANTVSNDVLPAPKGGVPPDEAPAETKPDYQIPGEEELSKMNRGQLNEVASMCGIKDPADMPNKSAVIEAIFATGGE